MKFNKFVAIMGLAVAVCACENELPYDLDGVEHGVAINIQKVAGSSTTLSTNVNEGDYRMLLEYSDYQGDHSMLKEVQLMAVYTDGNKNKKSAIVVSGITSLPATVTVDIKAACAKMGISSLNVGDRMEFTPCYTLKSGTQVNGWNELSGFNNTSFNGLSQGEATFQYRVSYSAFAPFYKEKFEGTKPFVSDSGDAGMCEITQITDLPDASLIPHGVSPEELVGLKIVGDFWFYPDEFVMWINTQDYTLIIPDQVINADFEMAGYPKEDGGFVEDCTGEVNTLTNEISFYYVPLFSSGYWWGQGFNVVIDCN